MCLLQGYAWEITTSEGGWGLHEVLQSRQDKLNGIVNGIDMSEWDPSNDADTAAAYSIDDLSGQSVHHCVVWFMMPNAPTVFLLCGGSEQL